MEKVVFHSDKCKSCELCVSVCPKKIIAISDKVNRLGFRPAVVTDQDKCTSCTLCARMCPHVVIEVYR